MNYRTTFHLLYRRWKGQQVIRWGRKGSDWIISFPAKERRKSFLEVHCDVSPLVENTVSAVVEYTDGSLFEFDGDIPADHPVNPLKKIPITQRRLDVGKITVHYVLADDDSGKARWDLKLSGKLLHGEFSLTTTDGVMYTLTRIKAVRTEAEEVLPIYVPLKASVRFEVDAEKDYDVSEAWAWIKEQKVDVLAQPKLNGFRVILDTSKNILYFEGDETDHAETYPELMKAGRQLGNFVFDGELVSDERLYLFSMLFKKDKDMRGEGELERYELLEKLNLQPPLYLMPSKVVKSEADLIGLLSSALQVPLAEGLMLKRVDTTNLQKWTVNWAKVKLVIYRVGEILDKIPVENRETFVYELGFKDAFGNITSLGTSMTTSTELEIGDHAVVSLPASSVWETPVIREKTKKEVDTFIPVVRVQETTTTAWVECMKMDAEIPTASCSRLIDIQTRTMEIYNYDWKYESERSYAMDVYQHADDEHDKCHAIPRVPDDRKTVDFREHQIGTSTEMNIWVYNDGRTDGDELFVLPLITKGADIFSVLSTPVWIEGGESTAVSVRGTPLSEGEEKGNLMIEFSQGNPALVFLTISGFPTPPPEKGQMDISPTSISFGSVEVGSPARQEITVRNIGQGNLYVTWNITNSAFNFYSSSLGGSYSPGEERTDTLIFSPPSVGYFSGEVSFFTDGIPFYYGVIITGVGR